MVNLIANSVQRSREDAKREIRNHMDFSMRSGLTGCLSFGHLGYKILIRSQKGRTYRWVCFHPDVRSGLHI